MIEFTKKIQTFKCHTACFSGYRYDKLRKSIPSEYSDSRIKAAIQRRIHNAAEHLIKENYNTFICGMADGFDLFCGEVIHNLKRTGHDINLICVIPFDGHMNNPTFRNVYKETLAEADHVLIINKNPNTLTNPDLQTQAYRQRNQLMLEHSSALICYYDGQTRSGTQYTYNRAMKMGLTVYNTCNSQTEVKYGHYTVTRGLIAKIT